MNLNFEILNSFVDSVAVINNKGEIIYTNSAWKVCTGKKSGDKAKADSGTNYLDLCTKITGEELNNTKEAVNGIQSVIKRKTKLFELEYPCHSANEKRWFLMRVIPVVADAEHTIVSHIDITRRKLAEEQAQAMNERMNTTMFRIVHDIQNPLQSIEGLIHLYHLKKTETARTTYISLIEKSVGKLKEFIKNTLIISGSGARAESIDFKALLDDLMESIKYNEIMKVIKVNVNVSQKEKFFSDKAEINSIISNIVSNSLKYYDPEKKEKLIDIKINISKTEAVISIKDNGIGMSKDTVSRIFELNYQNEKASGTGAGVGLHLVETSLRFLKGSVKVKSELGIGSEFIVSIPNLKSNAG